VTGAHRPACHQGARSIMGREGLTRWLAAAMLLAGAMAAAAEKPPDKPRTGLGEDARLAAEAKTLAETSQKKYGAGYLTQIDNQRHIVYVSTLDTYTMGRVTAMLGAYVDQHRRFLFRQPLSWNVTVILPTLSDYRRPLAAASFAGHYDPAESVESGVRAGRLAPEVEANLRLDEVFDGKASGAVIPGTRGYFGTTSKISMVRFATPVAARRLESSENASPMMVDCMVRRILTRLPVRASQM